MPPGAADPFKPLIALVAGVACACLALRLVYAYESSYEHRTHAYPTHLRMDALWFGVLIAYAYHFHRDWFHATFARRTRALAVAALGCLCPACLFEVETTPALYTVGLTLVYLGSAALLVALLLSPLPARLGWQALADIGAHSYSIYLWHLAVVLWGIPLLEWCCGGELAFGTRVPLYLVGSLAVGIVMAKAVEYPTLRLRDYWYPSRIGSVSASAAATS